MPSASYAPSNSDVARARLTNQRLIGTPFQSVVDAVGRLGALQAQDYEGAKWALAQRVGVASNASLEALMADGTILRTHVLRPTWHLVLPADIRWMLALTGPRISLAMTSSNARLDLSPAVFRRATDAMARALEGGKHLTRPEIVSALRRARIDASDGVRVAHLLMRAEIDAVICSGARRGKQITYALLDERAAPTPSLDRDDALSRLATRYFSTRAPATAHDFAWWAGLTISDARRGIEAAQINLTFSRKKASRPTKSVHLLPNFDELFIAYRDRSAVLQRSDGVLPMQRSTALAAHVIEIDGQLVGGWRRITTGKATRIETTYLSTVTADEGKAVQAQIARYEAFARNA